MFRPQATLKRGLLMTTVAIPRGGIDIVTTAVGRPPAPAVEATMASGMRTTAVEQATTPVVSTPWFLPPEYQEKRSLENDMRLWRAFYERLKTKG